MLIDLERNDLGRVCEAGTVRVDEFMSIETYDARAPHRLQRRAAMLRAGGDPDRRSDRAVFPGGTITGCPKVRCMQIIAELEGAARGAYTGSLGYLTRDGSTGPQHPHPHHHAPLRGQLSFRAGAGIVADSDRQRELAETRAKARGLLAALGPAVSSAASADTAGRRAAGRTRGSRGPRPALRRWPVRDPRLPRRPAALPRRCTSRACARRVRLGHRAAAAGDPGSRDRDAGRETAGLIVKLIVTRGMARGRGYRPGGRRAADARAVALPVAGAPAPGGRLRVRPCRSAENPRLAGLKHLNRLEQVLAQRERPPQLDEA